MAFACSKACESGRLVIFEAWRLVKYHEPSRSILNILYIYIFFENIHAYITVEYIYIHAYITKTYITYKHAYTYIYKHVRIF